MATLPTDAEWFCGWLDRAVGEYFDVVAGADVALDPIDPEDWIDDLYEELRARANREGLAR